MEVEYQYTEGGQIAKIIARDLTDGSGTDIYCQEFEYDVNGRKIRQVQKEKESDTDTAAYYVTTFAYDSRDMLVEEKYQRWDSGNSAWDNMYWARYKYDTAGNMVHREVDQIVNGSPKQYADGPFTYSRGYQLTGFTRKGAFGAETRTFTLTYDANGNMTHISQSATFTDTFYNITEMEFQFDEKNRMTHYRFGGSGSYHQIKYDALGRVRERVNLAPTTSKYYSDGRQLIQQLDNSDNVDFDYFRGPTGLMRQLDVDASNKKRFYIKDPLGTVLALVNPSDLSVTHYNYNAWGEHLDKDDTDFPTDTNSMRYIGCRVEAFGDSAGQTDAIYHLGRRHYIPVVTNFLQREPAALARGIELGIPAYSYSFNDPINKYDPSGLFPCCGSTPPTAYGAGSAGEGPCPTQDPDPPITPGPAPNPNPSPTPFPLPSPTPGSPPSPVTSGNPCCKFWSCLPSDDSSGDFTFRWIVTRSDGTKCACAGKVTWERYINGAIRNPQTGPGCTLSWRFQCKEVRKITSCYGHGWMVWGELRYYPPCDDDECCAWLDMLHFVEDVKTQDYLHSRESRSETWEWHRCACSSNPNSEGYVHVPYHCISYYHSSSCSWSQCTGVAAHSHVMWEIGR